MIVFNPLGEKELSEIVDIQLAEVNETLAQRKLSVEVSEAAKRWLLARAGVDPSTGARPLRRTIQRHLQDAISEALIRADGEEIERFEADVEGDELSLRVLKRELETSQA